MIKVIILDKFEFKEDNWYKWRKSNHRKTKKRKINDPQISAWQSKAVPLLIQKFGVLKLLFLPFGP